MKFYVEDLTKMLTPEMKTIYLFSTKQLASNKLLDLEIDIDDVSANKLTNPLIFSELKFDSATNTLTGKFFGGLNNRGSLNTMSNGSFSTILFKKVKNQRKSN